MTGAITIHGQHACKQNQQSRTQHEIRHALFRARKACVSPCALRTNAQAISGLDAGVELALGQSVQQRRLAGSTRSQQQQGSHRIARVRTLVEFATELRDGGVWVRLLQQVHWPLQVTQHGRRIRVAGAHKVLLQSHHFGGDVWRSGEGLENDTPPGFTKVAVWTMMADPT